MSEQIIPQEITKIAERENLEALKKRALLVLEQNRQEKATVPAQGLYPAVWDWDTAFIALGLSKIDLQRAEHELASLYEAQWQNGMVPSIAFWEFDPGKNRYFPDPRTWQVQRQAVGLAPDAADPNKSFADRVSPNNRVETSGITQPPVDGFTVLEVAQRETDPVKRREFLRAMLPKISAEINYLMTVRDPEQSGLASIVHPWEGGLDNSPRWADPLKNIPVTEAQVRAAHTELPVSDETHRAEYGYRQDIHHVRAQFRPTNEDYARYTEIVKYLRRNNYSDEAYKTAPFRVKDTLFNSWMYASTFAAKEIAQELGEDTSQIDRWLTKQRAGMQSLWDEENGLYFDYDAITNQPIKRKTISSFAALITDVPDERQVEKMVAVLQGPDFLNPSDKKIALKLVPSTAHTDPAYHAEAYWRGPAWINVNWMVAYGLRKQAERFNRPEWSQLAEELEQEMLKALEQLGFREYFNIETGEGVGTDSFSWSAALAVEMIERRKAEK